MWSFLLAAFGREANEAHPGAAISEVGNFPLKLISCFLINLK